MILSAVGDAIIQRRIHNSFCGIGELAPFIKRGEARFFNLETTLCRIGECPASQFSGGTYLRAEPEVLYDLGLFGFNMTSFNNNHALDYSYAGLERTLSHLDRSGLIHAGVGRNLRDAAMPRYLDTPSGRVALVSVSTSFHPTAIAGKGSDISNGRAGVNGIRVRERFKLAKQDLDLVTHIAHLTGINASRERGRAQGYLLPLAKGRIEFGEYTFEIGERAERIIEADEADVLRVVRSVREARFFADCVLVSIHSHQSDGEIAENAPPFLQNICHTLIDSGADAIVGHGPHLLRGIEIYRDRPIFYSLGDFILQLYSVEYAPTALYEKYGIGVDEGIYELLRARSRDFTVGLMEDRKMMESVIPIWESGKGGLVSLNLIPVELERCGKKQDMGLPRRASGTEILERMSELCAPFGCELEILRDGTAKVKL